MCGIFGVRISWLAEQAGDADARLQNALDLLRWRGRDDARIVRIGDFALGCARLAISGMSSTQPAVLRGARFAGVLNGAVTNARALWSKTRPRAARRALPNDAWLPPLLFATGGVEALLGMTGHHALVVADAARDEWAAVRDVFGEKPMFVLRDAGRPVAVASTIPALRALGAPFALGSDAVRRFFRYGSTGSVAHEAGRFRAADEPQGFGTKAQSRSLEQDGAEALPFRTSLERAVARCADCEPSIGLYLSGGIDSSCLAAELAAQGRSVRSYQFVAQGQPADERAIAASVASHCGHRLVPVDGGPEVLDALFDLTAMWGLPLGDPSLLAAHAVAKAAAADGVRVMLSGEGADELLFGYSRHRAVSRMPAFRLPLPCVRGWSMGRDARILRALASPHPYAALLEVTPPMFRAQALAPRLADVAGADDALLEQPARARGATASARLAHAAAVDRSFYLRADLLPKLDVATMAAQIEGRCPFLDAEVVRAAAAIPVADRLGKRPLRRSYSNALPAAVFAQRKRGFSLPLDRWFRGALPMLDLLRDVRTRQRPHLCATGLDRAIDLHRRGVADLGHALFLVVAFETWLRTEEARCA